MRIFLLIVRQLNLDLVSKLLPVVLAQLDAAQCKEAMGALLKRQPAPVMNAATLLVEIQCFAPTNYSPGSPGASLRC